ncbi:nuclear transport factor 2 family protein [Paraburkholderia dilworthii]|uniref:nuclear transport factor 2 family protein n=1 Tax=Paraburkholderia dilworthii TaxID=948106 RepID=UPI0006866826|nr:nuclear transport factor 2 family protein [Paraburkholderia dilworthii]
MPNTEQQSRIDALTQRVNELVAREDIRTCLYRINRGMDRIDAELLASGFFPDARIRWGTPEAVDFGEWLQAALAIQQKTEHVQHLIGNILIDLEGDRARVESYEIGRHLTPMGDDMKDLIIASRYIDTFEKRESRWRIVRRDKVVDWARIMEGSDPVYQHASLAGQRNSSDISFEMFGEKPFHSLV